MDLNMQAQRQSSFCQLVSQHVRAMSAGRSSLSRGHPSGALPGHLAAQSEH